MIRIHFKLLSCCTDSDEFIAPQITIKVAILLVLIIIDDVHCNIPSKRLAVVVKEPKREKLGEKLGSQRREILYQPGWWSSDNDCLMMIMI